MLSTDPITKNQSFKAKGIYHVCVKNVMLDDGFCNLCVSRVEHMSLIKYQGNNERYKWTFLQTWKHPRRGSKVSSFYIIAWTYIFPGFPLYTPWKDKKAENIVCWGVIRLSDFIRGFKKETLERNGLMKITLYLRTYWPFLKVSFYYFIYNLFLLICVQLKYA